MGSCINHPERETSYLCMKHNLYLCKDCLYCRDPEIYCKFRPSCPIWFISKRKAELDSDVEEKAAAAQTQFQVRFVPGVKTVSVP
jgi:hypothetical protein